MTWIAPSPPAAVDGPTAGNDRPILEGYLAWQRSTLLNICAGLTGEQLTERAVPTSNLSLLGWSATWRRWSGSGSGSEPPASR